MGNTQVVILKIVAMFLVMVVGWLGRRRGVVDAATTRTLSGFTTDLALPALIFAQMLRDVDREALWASGSAVLMAIGALLLGQLVGWAGWRLFCSRREAPTFIFVVSIANWIYLPLPIVQALWPADGVRVLLLCNAGVQVYLWTVGIATLHGGRLDRAALRSLATNPGLIATVAGIAVAMIGPAASPARLGLPGQAAVEALAMIGSLTIPLSLLVTGAQLGGMALASSRPTRALLGVVLLRLVVTPAIALGLLVGARAAMGPLPIPRLHVAIAFLITAMPVAVSCSILAERFGQDVKLAAQGILYTTVLSVATVPLLFWCFNRLMG